MEIVGELEAHVTVDCADGRLDGLASWARDRGLKLTHVVLARGAVVSQPMLTLRGHGSLRELRTEAERLAEDLTEADFPATRVKIEPAPWWRGVPETPERHQYFEHHVKVLSPQDAETEQPADAVGPHTAHVSRNARRIRADGQAEWFVTQSSRGVGGQDAARQPTELLDRLDGYPILSVEREFVIYDSNESIDEGWIE